VAAPQVPAGDAVVLDVQRAVGAADRDAARITGPCGRRRREGAERARGERHRGEEGVLDLDRMQGGGRARLDVLHVAEQEEQQVHGVDALVHQRAAAIERRRAAPRGARVVLGRAPPREPRVDQQHAAEAAGRDAVARLDERGRAAVLEEDAERDAGALDRLDRAVHVLERHVERLLAQHVAAAERGERDLVGMQAGGRADADEVERRRVEQRLERRRGGQSVFRRQCTDLGGVAAADADGLQSRHVADRTDVRVGDVAATGEPHADRHRVTPSSGPRERARPEAAGHRGAGLPPR